MNPTQPYNPIAFSGGSTLPQAGTEAYRKAQQGILTPSTSPTTSTPITSESLSPSPSLNISPMPSATSATGLSSEISSRISNDEKAYESIVARDYAENKNKKEQSSDVYSQILGLQQSELNLTDEAYQAADATGVSVDEAGRRLKNINNRILAFEIGEKEELKELQNNFRGSRQVYSTIRNEIITKNATAKADLYIEKLVNEGDFTSAKEIADRKVSAQLEQQKLLLQKAQFDYENNKDAFNKSEQRALELLYNRSEREIDKKERELKQFNDTKIDLLRSAASQGAPQSVIDSITKSKDVSEAINAAGEYGVDQLDQKIKQAQLAKLNQELSSAPLSGEGLGEGTNTNLSPEQVTEVDTALKLIKSGQAKLSDFKDDPLYKTIQYGIANDPRQNEVKRVVLEKNINQINELLSSRGLAGSVGPNPFARSSPDFDYFTGVRGDFTAGVDLITTDLTLDKLLAVKESGGTLGALSDAELLLLSQSATRIGSWKRKTKSGDVYYDTTDSEMKRELQKIKYYYDLALKRAGGGITPSKDQVSSYLDTVDQSLTPDPYATYNIQ